MKRPDRERTNEDLEAWTPPDSVPSMRNLEASRIRPLMNLALPRLTSSSTSGSQTRKGSSRLRELQERLQARALENAEREEQPFTWREHPVRSVVIRATRGTLTACTTDILERFGRQRNEREGMPSMMPLGQSTSCSREYPKAQCT